MIKLDNEIEGSLKLTPGSESEIITELRTDIDLKMYIDVNKVKNFVFVKDAENYVVDFEKLIQLGIVKKEK